MNNISKIKNDSYGNKRGKENVKFTLQQATRPRGEVEVWVYSFFNPGTRWG